MVGIYEKITTYEETLEMFPESLRLIQFISNEWVR